MYYLFHPIFPQLPYVYTSHYPVAQTHFVNPGHLYQENYERNHQLGRPIIQRKNQPTTQPANEYQYPPVDPDLLYESANHSKKLMEDASKVLNKLASSKEFGEQIMSEAQRSDKREVDRLISTIDVKSNVKITYNPDGLRLEFTPKEANSNCCGLIISLRWR
ncbi:hypothetical protein QUF56_12900 [Ureibacillus composti]|nr:hypothetical protein [Ureibacillus composti]